MKREETKEIGFWTLAKTLLVALFLIKVILIIFWSIGLINWMLAFSPSVVMIGIVGICYITEWTFERK